MNLTTLKDSSIAAQHSRLTRCQPSNNSTLSINATDAAYNISSECNTAESVPRAHSRVKTYHMQPRLFDDSLTFYSKYDPATGIRTASILGSILILVVFYGLYKTKCRKKEWTSQDQLFVEHYKKKFNGRKGRRGTDFAFMREPFHRSVETSVAMEQTAKWIQSQPLNASVHKNNFKSTMGNLCLESFKATMYPVCDSNNINQMPNGKLKPQEQTTDTSTTTNEMDIKRLNERNLKLDLNVAYKDMFPFRKNLWKSRSYDDKVNIRSINTLGCSMDTCPDITNDKCSIELDGEPSLTDSGLSQTTDSGSAAAAAIKYPLSPQIVDARYNVTGALPVLPLLVPHLPPPSRSLSSSSSHHQSLSLLPSISLSQGLHDIPMIDSEEPPLAAFRIGTPSSCSSLDNDECYSLTTSPQPPALIIIPPLPPYIPPSKAKPNENKTYKQEHVLQATKL